MNTVEALNEALKKVKSGWLKFKYKNSNSYKNSDRFCMLGALHATTKDPYVRNQARRALAEVLPQVSKTPSVNIMKFNDNFNTSKADVIVAFEQAIANEKGKNGN